MKHKRRDPRHLPNAEERRKTTEHLNKHPDNAPPDREAIKRAVDDLDRSASNR
jgi:hypothetical protein